MWRYYPLTVGAIVLILLTQGWGWAVVLPGLWMLERWGLWHDEMK